MSLTKSPFATTNDHNLRVHDVTVFVNNGRRKQLPPNTAMLHNHQTVVGTLLAISQQPQWQEEQSEDASTLASEPEPRQRDTDTFFAPSTVVLIHPYVTATVI